MALLLKLLGEFSICDPTGMEQHFPIRKNQALLGYLAANADKPLRRDRLTGLLWSNRTDKLARHSLNQALSSIRSLARSTGIMVLKSHGEQVMLVSSDIDIDLTRFNAIRRTQPAEAAALYIGPFLDGLIVPEPAFEDWVTGQRTQLHERACETLKWAADAAARNRNYNDAIAFARRLLALEPLHEDGHRRLMYLLFNAGNRAAALRQYQTCAEVLYKALQIEPEMATEKLFEEIRAGNSSNFSTSSPPLISGASRFGSALPEPALPSIAVLPFDNLGDDPSQDVFGDGIAEDIITELSRFRSLFVISRGSSFSFRGHSRDIRKVARELGVRYVVVGSIRAHGPRVRINAQLIDASTGQQLWSERYDREMGDIFVLQDDITRSIVGVIEPTISAWERGRIQRQTSLQLDAWALFQSGLAHYYNQTSDDLNDAITYFDKAIVADPKFAAAYAMRADAIVRSWIYFRYDDRAELLASAQESAETAIRLDPQDARGLLTLGRVQTLLGNSSAAISLVDRALELNPNLAMAHYARGFILVNSEASEEGLEDSLQSFDRAIRLSPNDPFITGFMSVRARVLLQMKRYTDAAESAQFACQSPNPRPWAFAFLAIALKQLGRFADSNIALGELRRRFPDFNSQFARRMQHWPAASQSYFERLLRSTGVPD